MLYRSKFITNESKVEENAVFADNAKYRKRLISLRSHASQSDLTDVYIKCGELAKKIPKSMKDFKRDEMGRTLLHLAVIAEDCDKITEIKEFVDNINPKLWGILLQDYQNTFLSPLMLASTHGCNNGARLLIEYGADVNEKGKNNFTPLMSASVHGHKDVAKILVKNKADLNLHNSDKETAFMLAAKHQNVGCFNLLLSSGALVNKTSKDKLTALDFAIKSKICKNIGHAGLLAITNGMLTYNELDYYNKSFKPNTNLKILLCLGLCCGFTKFVDEVENKALKYFLDRAIMFFLGGVTVGCILTNSERTYSFKIGINYCISHLCCCNENKEIER